MDYSPLKLSNMSTMMLRLELLIGILWPFAIMRYPPSFRQYFSIKLGLIRYDWCTLINEYLPKCLSTSFKVRLIRKERSSTVQIVV